MSVKMEIRDAVARVTLNRPRQGNSIDIQFARQFLAFAQTIEANVGVRAVVITGTSTHFCLGGDLRAMAAAGGSASAFLSEVT